MRRKIPLSVLRNGKHRLLSPETHFSESKPLPRMNPYLVFILAVLLLNSAWDLLVNLLNLKQLDPNIPDEFQGYYDNEKYTKSQNYLRDSTRFGLVSTLIKTSVLILFILLGGFRILQETAASFSDQLIVQGLIFAGLLMLLSTLFGLPFSIYDTFVLEARYGFNKTTPATFVVDMIKSLGLTLLLGAPVFAALLAFFQFAGGNAWWISWVTVTAIQLLLLYLAPVYILPIFNKFEPLEEGELRSAIEAYAVKEGFEVSGLFSIDGSKRSTRANAYFTGFGKMRRIALFDTLIEKHSVDQLVAVLAHEVGHAKCKHIHKQLAVALLSSGFMFFLLSLFLSQPGLYEAFGITTAEPLPLYAGLVFFGFLYSPISSLLGFLTNFLSRKFEFEADAFAAHSSGKAGDLIEALKLLSVDNLSNLRPHRWLVAFEYSHPPVLQRIEALRKLEKA